MRYAVILFVLAFASPALADAIGPPTPIECPPGTVASTNHCGTVCMVEACTSDADCGIGRACTARALCTEEVPCGGWGGMYTIVHGSCESGACTEGACAPAVLSCAQAIAPPTPDAGTEPRHVTYGCGCRAASRASIAPMFFVLAVTIGAVRALRRR